MMIRRFVAVLVIATLLVVVYTIATRPAFVSPTAYSTVAPIPLPGYDQDTAYVAAQATLAAGQSEVEEMSQQATMSSLSRSQAANAADQATLDHNQRQLLDLSIRATEISQNMAGAAATQQFIVEQAQMAKNATVAAQSLDATATHAVYMFDVTRRAQAAQADATRTAFSLTATPLAAIQADIALTQSEAARRAWWDEVVLTPLTALLLLLTVLLLIAGAVRAYLQLMPLLKLRLGTVSRIDHSPRLMVDGIVVDSENHRQLGTRQPREVYLRPLPSGKPVEVEIIGPSEPAIINWITEAEQKLRGDRWI